MAYDKGFTTTVDSDGSVRVTSEHYVDTVWHCHPFPPFGGRSVKAMRRKVERMKKSLAKQEDKFAALKEEFKW
jgi:ribosomal protein L31